MPHAASIYDKLRSLARRSSRQWRRESRVCRLASGLASTAEFARKTRYSWLQLYQLEKRLIYVESIPRVTEKSSRALIVARPKTTTSPPNFRSRKSFRAWSLRTNRSELGKNLRRNPFASVVFVRINTKMVRRY